MCIGSCTKLSYGNIYYFDEEKRVVTLVTEHFISFRARASQDRNHKQQDFVSNSNSYKTHTHTQLTTKKNKQLTTLHIKVQKTTKKTIQVSARLYAASVLGYANTSLIIQHFLVSSQHTNGMNQSQLLPNKSQGVTN